MKTIFSKSGCLNLGNTVSFHISSMWQQIKYSVKDVDTYYSINIYLGCDSIKTIYNSWQFLMATNLQILKTNSNLC